jgi:hypothetical protein
MSKPETLKDIIDETMRVSGVSYPVPVREKQFGGDHYKRMGIEPWDVVDTWPLEQRDWILPRRCFEVHHAHGQQGRATYKKRRRVCTTKKS